VASTVLYFFSDFRTQEFRKRLRQKSVTTYELIQQSREKNFDYITKINDRKEDELFNEKIYIINNSKNIVYASTILPLNYSNLLDYKILDAYKVQFIQFQNHEIDISKYKTLTGDFYIIIDAQDTYGYAKLKYLISALAISLLFFAIIAFVMTSYVIARLLNPLQLLINKIKTINENNLDESIPVRGSSNEIDVLAAEFNMMLQRIHESLKSQKEFTANASHELRTPISRIIVRLENYLQKDGLDEEVKLFYKKLLNDSFQLSELIDSLLILSKNQQTITEDEHLQRIDEIMYDSIEKVKNLYPDFKIYFDFVIDNEGDDIKEVRGVRTLLEIAFMNMLKNAYLYSDNKQVEINLLQKKSTIECTFVNSGNTIIEEDLQYMYKPFMRGSNAKDKTGFGLGLRIVERILHLHKATIQYAVNNDGLNEFKITFHF
jgi:signal transduction histidine kinase